MGSTRKRGSASRGNRKTAGATPAAQETVNVKDLEKTLLEAVGKAVSGVKRQDPAKASSNYFRLTTGEGKTLAYVNQGKKGLSLDALDNGSTVKLGRVETEADIPAVVKKIEERAKALASA